MKQLNSLAKEGRIYLKAFPSAKTNQLNHYVIPTLEDFNSRKYQRHSSNKDMSELKQLPKKNIIIMQIGANGQICNIGKVYVSCILPSTRTSIDIGQINKVTKELCDKNNFVFADHQEMIKI